jgi:hypothetical protein
VDKKYSHLQIYKEELIFARRIIKKNGGVNIKGLFDKNAEFTSRIYK